MNMFVVCMVLLQRQANSSPISMCELQLAAGWLLPAKPTWGSECEEHPGKDGEVTTDGWERSECDKVEGQGDPDNDSDHAMEAGGIDNWCDVNWQAMEAFFPLPCWLKILRAVLPGSSVPAAPLRMSPNQPNESAMGARRHTIFPVRPSADAVCLTVGEQWNTVEEVYGITHQPLLKPPAP